MCRRGSASLVSLAIRFLPGSTYMKRLTAIAALAVLGLALTAPAAVADDTDTDSGAASESSDLERVSAYVQPSVVYLQMKWKGYVWDRVLKQYVNEGAPFEVTTQCTGYVVNPDGYIATAGHCVDPKGDVEDMLALQAAQWEMDQGLYDNTITAAELAEVLRVEGFETTNKGPDREVVAAWGVSAGGVQTGKSYNARVVKYQPFDQGDAAVIKVEATDLPAIQIAEDSELEVGTEIVSVGYPASVDLVADQSFSPSFKDGSISSEKTLQGGQFTAYEISAAVSGGMSGGPTVDLDGEVVGFNSFKIDPSVESQQFNFVRSTSIINELMADVGVENELGEVSENYYAGLDAYFAGDKDAAIESLQAVIDDQPTNTMAADFLSKAKDMPEEEAASSDDGGGFPIALVGGIGVAVLVLIGLVVFFIARRGKGGQSGQGGPSPAMPAGAAPGGSGGWATPPAAPAQPTRTSNNPMPAGPAAPVTAQAAPAPQAATPPPVQPQAPAPPPPAPSPAPAAPMASAPTSPPAPPAAPPAQSESVGFQPSAAPEPAAPVEQQVQEQPVVPAQAHAFCGNCGTRAVAGQKFCGNCGATL